MTEDSRDLRRVRTAAEEAEYDPDSERDASDLKSPIRTLGFWGEESTAAFEFSVESLAGFAVDPTYPPEARLCALAQFRRLVAPESTYEGLFRRPVDEIGDELVEQYGSSSSHRRTPLGAERIEGFLSAAEQYIGATTRLRVVAARVAKAGANQSEADDHPTAYDRHLGDLREAAIETLASVGKRAGGETLLRVAHSLADLSVEPTYPEQPIALDVLQELVLEADDHVLSTQPYATYRNQIADASDSDDIAEVTPRGTYSGVCHILCSTLIEASSRRILPSKERWTRRYTKRYPAAEIGRQNALSRLVDVGEMLGGRWLLAVVEYLHDVATNPSTPQGDGRPRSRFEYRTEAVRHLTEVSRSTEREHTGRSGDPTRSTAVEPTTTGIVRIERSVLEAAIRSHTASALAVFAGEDTQFAGSNPGLDESLRKKARGSLLNIGCASRAGITADVAETFKRIASREGGYPDDEETFKRIASREDGYPKHDRVHARECLAELCRRRPLASVFRAYFSDEQFRYTSPDERVQETTELFEFAPLETWSLLFPQVVRSLVEARDDIDTSVCRDALRTIASAVSDPEFDPSLSDYQVHFLDVTTPWGESLMECEFSRLNDSNPLLIDRVDGTIGLIAHGDTTPVAKITISHDRFEELTTHMKPVGAVSNRSVELTPRTGTLVFEGTLGGERSPWIELQLQPDRQLSHLGLPTITETVTGGAQPSSTSGESSPRPNTTSLDLPRGRYTLLAACPDPSAQYGIAVASVSISTDTKTTCSVDVPFGYTHSSRHEEAIQEIRSEIDDQEPGDDLSAALLDVARACLGVAGAIPDHGRWFMDGRFDPEPLTQSVIEVSEGIATYLKGRERGDEFHIDEFRQYLPEGDELTTVGSFLKRGGVPSTLLEALGFHGRTTEQRAILAHEYLVQENHVPTPTGEPLPASVRYALFAADGFRSAVSLLNSEQRVVDQQQCLELLETVGQRTPEFVVENRDALESVIVESWSRTDLTDATSTTHIGIKVLLQALREDERVAVDAFDTLGESLISFTKILVRTLDDPVWDTDRVDLCRLFEAMAKWSPDRLRNEYDRLGSYLSPDNPPEIKRSLARCLVSATQGSSYVRTRQSTYLEYLLRPLEGGQQTDPETTFYCLCGIAELLSVSEIDESTIDRVSGILPEPGTESSSVSTQLHTVAVSLVLTELATTAPDEIPTTALSDGIHEESSRRGYTRVIAMLSSASAVHVERFVPELETMLTREIGRADEHRIRCPYVVKALSTIESTPTEELQQQYSTLLTDGGHLTTYYTCKAIHHQYQDTYGAPEAADWLEALDSVVESGDGVVSLAAQRARQAATGGSRSWVAEDLEVPPESAERFLECGHWFATGIGRRSVRQYEWLSTVHRAHLHRLRARFGDSPSLEPLHDVVARVQDTFEEADGSAVVGRGTHAALVEDIETLATGSTSAVFDQATGPMRETEYAPTEASTASSQVTAGDWIPDAGYGTATGLDEFEEHVFESKAFDPVPEDAPETPALPDDDFEIADRHPNNRGGQATIEKGLVDARDTTVPVAIKRTKRLARTTNPSDLGVIIDREARNWQEVHDHPHIIELYDINESGGQILMEYLDGGDLRERCGDMSVPHALWIGISIADALQYAHRRGIKHLDVKPRNIVLAETEGVRWAWPKLGDWGLSQELYSHSGRPNYTQQYAGPELRGHTSHETDIRTDVYQLAATLYHLLGDTPPRHLEQADRERPTSLREWNSKVSETLDHVVQQGLAIDITDRWASMRVFKIALLQAATTY